jgi:diguanylate cyclase (GGDEF)-like protein
MRNISIEMKVVIGIILFTFLIVGVERYQLSNNVFNQFIQSKKSKNALLINTISPIIALNISLGLKRSNQEYLEQIVKQNSDIESLKLSHNNKTIFEYVKNSKMLIKKGAQDVNFVNKKIIDSISGEKIGLINIYFSDKELQEVQKKNRETTLTIIILSIVLLLVFIVLIRREFRELKKLSQGVLNYDPKLNNLTLSKSDRLDEVGVIHNAIMSMVQKINVHSQELDRVNLLLDSKVKIRTKELEAANEQLKTLSITDRLTQLYNRRYFEQHLEHIWDIASRKNTKVSIIMCDIDFFKHVNDRHGHLVGDNVLRKIAEMMKYSLKRSSDFIARYGGEEFIIVMYDTDTRGALELCTTIQENLKVVEHFDANNLKIKSITLSFGISSIMPNKDNNFESLIRGADSALYKAKNSGRNCIIINESI